jgi:excisionase family DNA binding protein
MKRRDGSLGTSQIAKMLSVSPNMVVKWIDSGMLAGWKVPGSKHRRVSQKTVAEFAKRYDIPLKIE